MLAETFRIFYQVVIGLLFARAVMSWVVRDFSHPLPRFIYELTEPLLMPMRELFARLGLMRGGIDFSFLATLLLFNYLGQMFYVFLRRIGV